MKSILKILIYIVIVLFFAQACAAFVSSPTDTEGNGMTGQEGVYPVSPTPAPRLENAFMATAYPLGEPTQTEFQPTPVLTAEDLETSNQAQTILWAVEATASSVGGDPGYHASQALREPNTHLCGDFVTAWKPSEDEDTAWISLSFSSSIMPEEIHVYQSFQPGQIRRIEVETLEDETLIVFDAQSEERGLAGSCPAENVFWIDQVESYISTVHISIERIHGEPWTQIDAVSVVGMVSEEPTEMEPTSLDLPDNLPNPAFFSNPDLVERILMVDGELWTAGPGGVTRWNLETLQAKGYTYSEGLPANSTYALTHCSWDGGTILAGGTHGISQLWLAGEDQFHPIFHPGDTFLGRVEALTCDEDKMQVWVGYADHVSRYNLSDQTWQEYGYEEGVPLATVRQIRVFDGEVWLATSNGLAVLGKEERFTPVMPVVDGTPIYFVHALTKDTSGTLWLATSNGLVSFDGGNAWKLWPMNAIGAENMGNVLPSLVELDDGTFWLADYFGGLCQFDPNKEMCVQVLDPPQDILSVTSLSADRSGKVVIGSNTIGIFLWSDGKWQSLTSSNGLLDNEVLALAYTPDGRMWVAGSRHLQYFDANMPAAEWVRVDLPRNGRPLSFFVANDGLWIGHSEGALFLFYIGELRIDLARKSGVGEINEGVTAITRDENGLLYLGTYKGLYIWDGGQLRFEDLNSGSEIAQGAQPAAVHCLLKDGQRIWVGTARGLYQFNDGVFSMNYQETLQNLTGNPNVKAIAHIPASQDLLVGVSNRLYRFDGSEFSLEAELPSAVCSLQFTGQGLWIATSSNGLFSVSMDYSGFYWETLTGGMQFADKFGHQAIQMPDPNILWFASRDAGIARLIGMFGQ